MEERRNYSEAFKLEAVRLLSLGEVSASQLARELDLRRNQLYKWRDQLADKGKKAAFSGPGRRAGSASLKAPALGGSETAATKISRLERELSEVREERDILKNGGDVLRARAAVKYAFIETQAACHVTRIRS